MIDFGNPVLLFALAVLAIGLLLLAAKGLKRLAEDQVRRGAHPAIINALVNGVFQAEKAAADLFASTQVLLQGVDKKRLATLLYDELPATIKVGPFVLPVKQLLSEETFEELVQQTYDMLCDGYDYIYRQAVSDLSDDRKVEILPMKSRPLPSGRGR
jgi:hypothetical protein